MASHIDKNNQITGIGISIYQIEISAKKEITTCREEEKKE
jgi:hypothetical protein